MRRALFARGSVHGRQRSEGKAMGRRKANRTKAAAGVGGSAGAQRRLAVAGEDSSRRRPRWEVRR